MGIQGFLKATAGDMEDEMYDIRYIRVLRLDLQSLPEVDSPN